jgi:hypothetical protein
MRLAAALLLPAFAQQPKPPAYTHALAGNPDDASGKGRGGYLLSGGGTQSDAFNVYRIDASGAFDLPAWRGTGGLAYSLDAVNGVITSSRGELY